MKTVIAHCKVVLLLRTAGMVVLLFSTAPDHDGDRVSLLADAASTSSSVIPNGIKFLNARSSASRSRTRVTGRCASTAASRLASHCLFPMLMGYADISMAHLTVRGETLRLPAQKDRA
jgi:hypothetical protein